MPAIIKKETKMTAQSERIYTHLRVFGTITNAQAHSNYGIRHLPSVIRDIKKDIWHTNI